MAKKPKRKSTTSTRKWSPAQLAVQAAGRTTGDLRNHLQKVSKAYLLVGQLLTEVRDRKHYVTLHNETMEEYAEKRLQLFDQIIRLMENDLIVETAGLGILDDWRPKSNPGGFFSGGSMLA